VRPISRCRNARVALLYKERSVDAVEDVVGFVLRTVDFIAAFNETLGEQTTPVTVVVAVGIAERGKNTLASPRRRACSCRLTVFTCPDHRLGILRLGT